MASNDNEIEKKEVHSVQAEGDSSTNAFQNDGSFFEMFKKRMEEQQKQNSTSKSKTDVSSKKALKDTEPPCFATQTMLYKNSEGDGNTAGKKSQYQVT